MKSTKKATGKVTIDDEFRVEFYFKILDVSKYTSFSSKRSGKMTWTEMRSEICQMRVGIVFVTIKLRMSMFCLAFAFGSCVTCLLTDVALLL